MHHTHKHALSFETNSNLTGAYFCCAGRQSLPAVTALVGILLTVTAVPLRMGYHLAAPGALQHLCTAGTQVLPEVCKLHHDAACCHGHRQAVLGLCLVGLQTQGRALHIKPVSQGFYSRWGQLAHLTNLQSFSSKQSRQNGNTDKHGC
jgi:hypothetical protein